MGLHSLPTSFVPGLHSRGVPLPSGSRATSSRRIREPQFSGGAASPRLDDAQALVSPSRLRLSLFLLLSAPAPAPMTVALPPISFDDPE